jgi:hypothetical protein
VRACVRCVRWKGELIYKRQMHLAVKKSQRVLWRACICREVAFPPLGAMFSESSRPTLSTTYILATGLRVYARAREREEFYHGSIRLSAHHWVLFLMHYEQRTCSICLGCGVRAAAAAAATAASFSYPSSIWLLSESFECARLCWRGDLCSLFWAINYFYNSVPLEKDKSWRYLPQRGYGI